MRLGLLGLCRYEILIEYEIVLLRVIPANAYPKGKAVRVGISVVLPNIQTSTRLVFHLHVLRAPQSLPQAHQAMRCHAVPYTECVPFWLATHSTDPSQQSHDCNKYSYMQSVSLTVVGP